MPTLLFEVCLPQAWFMGKPVLQADSLKTKITTDTFIIYQPWMVNAGQSLPIKHC
jgi:hypothetical protein